MSHPFDVNYRTSIVCQMRYRKRRQDGRADARGNGQKNALPLLRGGAIGRLSLYCQWVVSTPAP